MGFVLAGDIVDDDRRAGLGQSDRHRPADARIGAGDQRLLPGKRSAGNALPGSAQFAFP